MYTNPDSLIKTEFTPAIRKHFYSVLSLASDAYNDLIKDPLFNAPFSGNIKSRLFRYCIFNQFQMGLVPSNLPLNCRMKPVNNFNEVTVDLLTQSIVFNFRKNYNGNILANPPRYYRKAAKNNVFQEKQLLFDMPSLKVVDEDAQYFAILLYEMIDGKISALSIALPSQDMRQNLYYQDLTPEYLLFSKTNELQIPKEAREESLMKLKEFTLNRKESTDLNETTGQ